MERLVYTSAGATLIEFDRIPAFRLSVEVTLFDEDGREQESGTWIERPRDRGPSLTEFLAETLRLPDAEAEELAERITGPWMQEWERGPGPENARATRVLTIIIVAGLGVLFVFALAGIVLLLRLVV